jgi:mannose-1-phosphate guanylyltransferase
VRRGNFFWNAGMFFWRASTVLDLIRHHQPKTATLLGGLPSFRSKGFMAKLRAAYPLCDNISVDYALIEKASGILGIAADDIGWNDVGSWEAVYELATKDGDRNASCGELFARESHGNYVDADKAVALLGVDDLIVVDTPDALLIAHRGKAQDVSQLVKILEKQKRDDLL